MTHLSDPLTPARLSEIRARAEAATVGPWRIKGHEVVRESDGLPLIQSLWVADVDPSHPDAAFIASARQDVPDLLDEVDRQVGEISRRKEAFDVLNADSQKWEDRAVEAELKVDRLTAAFDAALAEARAGALEEAAEGWTDRLARQMHARDYLNDRATEIREAQK